MNQQKLIEIAKDKRRGCVERGEAIIMLLKDHEVDQQRLEELTGLTDTTVSRLKVCYENLSPPARRYLRTAKIHVNACHQLGLKVASEDQVRVIALAQEFAKKRESERPLQMKGPRGRQSPKGLITEDDMQQAISAEKQENRVELLS